MSPAKGWFRDPAQSFFCVCPDCDCSKHSAPMLPEGTRCGFCVAGAHWEPDQLCPDCGGPMDADPCG